MVYYAVPIEIGLWQMTMTIGSLSKIFLEVKRGGATRNDHPDVIPWKPRRH